MAVATTTLKGLQTLLDRIRRMIDPAAVMANDELVEAYNEYDEALREANERLRDCDELLRDGHRSQALQHCEQEPDLLQVVALLDFADRPLWHAVLQEAGFTPPPAVQLDVAAELNEAYNLEKPLTDLMRAHRLHALAGSPLKTRLGFLRKIAERDSDNPIWAEDVRQYERARQRQIEQELIGVERSGDADQAAQLERELSNSKWQESPPKPLVETAVRLQSQLRQARARAKLKQLAAELHDALGSRDEAPARQLRQAWNAQVTMAHLPASDPLFEQVEPVFDWLDRTEAQRKKEHSHKVTLAALEQALDSGAGRIELERSYNEVTRFGPVSDALNRKVQLRVEYIERRTRLRWISGVVVVLALIAVCASGMAWYAHRAGQEQEAQRQIASFTKLVEDRNLKGADTFLSELKQKNPLVAGRPEISALEKKLADLQSKEHARLEELRELRESLLAHLEKGSLRELDDGRSEFQEAEKKGLFHSDAEQREIKELNDKLSAGILAHEGELNQRFREKFEDLSQRIEDRLKRMKRSASLDDRDALEQLKREAEVLGQPQRVQPQLLSRVPLLTTKLNGAIASLEEQRREQAALANLQKSVTSLNSFAAALERYAKAFPQSGRGTAFAKLLQEELPVWKSVEEWNSLVAKWSNIDFHLRTPDEAKGLGSELETFDKNHGTFPATPKLQALTPYLEAIQKRVDGEGNRVDKHLAEDVLRHPLITVPNMLVTRDRQTLKRYYLTTPTPEHLCQDPMD